MSPELGTLLKILMLIYDLDEANITHVSHVFSFGAIYSCGSPCLFISTVNDKQILPSAQIVSPALFHFMSTMV